MSKFLGPTTQLTLLALANKHVLLPLVETAVVKGSVLAGQDEEEAVAEVELINQKIFDPIFSFFGDIEGSILNEFESIIGVDLNLDGDIGKPSKFGETESLEEKKERIKQLGIPPILPEQKLLIEQKLVADDPDFKPFNPRRNENIGEFKVPKFGGGKPSSRTAVDPTETF